ncbi:MAG: DUF1847 domain-containing protein [bacterium]|nr:DUF1847 domain-containing protein [bacterium]
MRYAVPLLKDRVAPRCTIAEGLLLVSLDHNRVAERRQVTAAGASWPELMAQLAAERVDTLVCGGISRDEKRLLLGRNIVVIENVACTDEEIVAAIESGSLYPGFGFGPGESADRPTPVTGRLEEPEEGPDAALDCLACEDRVCLRGEACGPGAREELQQASPISRRMAEAALDISAEEERVLCRLSELIYFCLDMGFRRLGVAYCRDLEEPARILTRVLRRFFTVVPVCCKIGGVQVDDYVGEGRVACNPAGQARELNRARCDLNVIVGLCMGVDCVFTSHSDAPVTTLFVKDRSLANNPIGALYSDYYLKEALQTPHKRIQVR